MPEVELRLRSFDSWYEYVSQQEIWRSMPEKWRLHAAFVHGILHGAKYGIASLSSDGAGKPGEPSHPRKSDAETFPAKAKVPSETERGGA